MTIPESHHGKARPYVFGPGFWRGIWICLSIGFFFVLTVAFGILDGEAPTLNPGYITGKAVAALLWGVLFFPIILWLNRRASARAGVLPTWGQPGTPHSGDVVIEGDPAHVLQRAQNGVARISNSKDIVTDTDRFVIQARTGMSWKSWGERIRVEVQALDGGRVRVRAESCATFPLTMVDYGRNAENVRTVLQSLSSDTH